MRQIQQTPSAGPYTALDCQYQWLDYEYRSIYANGVCYVMLCYYYFMKEVTPSAEAGINGEPWHAACVRFGC